MPTDRTVHRWIEAKEDFRQQYARAREAQADAIFDEILEIVDDGTNDWVERTNSDGSKYTVVDHEHVSRSKLRVDARKWIAAKLAPKKYGDEKTINIKKSPLDDADPSVLARLADVLEQSESGAQEGPVSGDEAGTVH
nr:terminase small subunit protein [Denitrobaculum tricleocarpae]